MPQIPEGIKYLRVVNWETFQHYKDRNPPWIKLYNSLLEDPAVAALPDNAKSHLIGVWLLASRLANRIPNDASFIGNRINANSKVDLNLLYSMGFIEPLAEPEQDASNMLATCATETETETEQREREIQRCISQSENPANGHDPAFADEVWSAFLAKSEQSPTRLMSPTEYGTLRKWLDAKIPLQVVLRGITDTRGKGRMLGYFDSSVQDAYSQWLKAVPP